MTTAIVTHPPNQVRRNSTKQTCPAAKPCTYRPHSEIQASTDCGLSKKWESGYL